MNVNINWFLVVAIALCSAVFWTFTGRKASSAALGCGLTVAIFGAYGLYTDTLFDGKVTYLSGIIDNLNEAHGRGGPFYLIDYHYNAAGQQIVVKETRIPFIRGSQLKIGEELPLKCLPDQPQESRVNYVEVDQFYWRKDLSFSLFGILAIFVGIYKWNQ